jgi:trans-aconitate methyltransferase
LTAEIASRGALVTGLDSSPDMLSQARSNYPDLTFIAGDATSFRVAERFDAVFSNAALHWVKNADAAAESIALALRPGGRFVAEFGGKGNIAAIMAVLRAVLGAEADERCPWYYPGIAEYSSVLERHGLEVRQAALFDRPTPLEGENAMEDWLEMFCGSFLPGEKRREVVDRLRPQCYRDGVWTVDYRRLRVLAVAVG